jgi:hypothetical protein
MQNENTQTTPELTINYVEDVQATKLSATELFEKLCNLHREINMLTDDAKQLMQDNKESLDVGMINNIAKAYVKDKVGDMEDKMQETLTMIDNLINTH